MVKSSLSIVYKLTQSLPYQLTDEQLKAIAMQKLKKQLKPRVY